MTATRQRVLVTGANGFVGSALVHYLARQPNTQLRAASRGTIEVPAGVEHTRAPDLGEDADWSKAVDGVDTVLHCAARVHVMHAGADSLQAFRAINVDGTRTLAQQAARAGTRRFVYLSSIKVNGERTASGKAFSAEDTPTPIDPYGISKYEAEKALQDQSATSGMAYTIVRPPLVYGPGVKANFLRLVRLVARRIPLPFGAIRNRRSLIGLSNLVDLLATCARHPGAANQIFLASDDNDLSTPELVRAIADAMSIAARLVPVPPSVLRAVSALVGRPGIAQRLCDSLAVDVSKTRQILEWSPASSVREELRRTTRAAGLPS